MSEKTVTWSEFREYVRTASPTAMRAMLLKKDLLIKYKLNHRRIDNLLKEYTGIVKDVKDGEHLTLEQQERIKNHFEDFFKREVKALSDADVRIENAKQKQQQ